MTALPGIDIEFHPRNPDIGARRALKVLGADPQNWVLPAAGLDHDVLIIGGGQVGIATAFALRRSGVPNVSVIDEAEEGGAGVWLTRARMVTLRTPKTAPGPELGIPELSFQYWYEALHGEAAFAAIGRIARTDWAEYLKWYQKIVAVPVRHRVRLLKIESGEPFLRVRLLDNGVEKVETARKIVFATGMSGTGGPYVPPIISRNLPRSLYAHTADEIDFEALRGKYVAVLGAATSALDVAATALEAGAAEVHLFYRRADLAGTLKGGAARGLRTAPGVVDNYQYLPDRDRWHLHFEQTSGGAVTPFDSVLRAAKFPNFRLHFNAPWNSVREEGGKVAIEAGDGSFLFDFAIAGTGYQYDPATRPEFEPIAKDIALWRDVYRPPVHEASENMGSFPYLGPAYELTEKEPGKAPYLRNIHTPSGAARLSFGRPVGDVPGLRHEIPRLVSALVRDLFFSDYRNQFQVLDAKPSSKGPTEFDRSKYEHAIWRHPAVEAEAAAPLPV
ncbi:Predicted flavoprotein CzcO associated with the cation diffusion facilitator CzcD [Verrucomicrobium sp. GAS474]|uniref:NAD(P)-binding domain-containing protein n=1 Tax=Verrucomicrobium sp. GAS474 TaxID=1882831 RepID=UPI00087AD01E|nr:NAD(P)/FAD-dependent oxidoreductase [Verrucomicrobium sp. GAS474]SDT85750.1 Predicted flavoprotein CzcO associated with the cation diffusion facilitator CzcD [Verrucomicrobium sp. GAS474]